MTATDKAVLARIVEKVNEHRAEAARWEALAIELKQHAGGSNGSSNNLRQVVKDILMVSPDRRLPRKEIIQQVRQRLGTSVKPIGVISTLHAKQDFQEVSDGVYTAVA